MAGLKQLRLVVNWILAALVIAVAAPAHGAGRIIGADGHGIRIDTPVERIVTLTPHLTELVFAAGAGDKLVGVARYSNYPEAARQLPRVGDAYRVDLERILALRPDLVLGWKSSSADRAVERLRALGLAVLVTEIHDVADIAALIIQIGQLAGTEQTAKTVADSFRTGMDALRARHRDDAALRVFYQISAQPLFTIGGAHFINEIITLCGGLNIFNGLEILGPRVSEEAVLARNPQVIFAGVSEGQQNVFARWRQWPNLAAVADNNMYTLRADLVHRPTPRLLQGARLMCAHMEDARTDESGPTTDPLSTTAKFSSAR